jgi:hypothetical protein
MPAQAKTGQAMNVDDRYRARLQSAIAALRYWTPSIADQATIAETDGADYWEIDSAPHTQGACPFELVLRSDGKHNIVIASETYEDETTDNLELFVPLLSAIARGQVTRRITTSAATRMPLAIETIVHMDNGAEWHRRRELAAGLYGGLPHEVVIRDHHFLPYKRD